MIRYFFQCAYDGTDFCGWQRQPNAISVQETIEKAITKLNRNQELEIVGCGRTDAGVHAKDYWFHVDLESEIDAQQWVYKLNKMLPTSIAIIGAKQVSLEIHARFSATNRTYRYFINSSKLPFLAAYSWYVPQRLVIENMNEAAQYLLGEQDFTSFSKLHTDVKTNICTIEKAQWYVDENGIYFEITANRFLRNMVRSIVGTLMEVGFGKVTPDHVKTVIAAKNRSEAAVSVPANGLFLWEIGY
ncbi:MAG: hypothetical protein RL264_2748 [Bacteroidota bacterium]|jgi:tRNA pseudouridine38-40 synthase